MNRLNLWGTHVPVLLVRERNDGVHFALAGAWDSESHRESMMEFIEAAGIKEAIRF